MQFIFNRLRLTLEEEEDIQKISIPQFQGLTIFDKHFRVVPNHDSE